MSKATTWRYGLLRLLFNNIDFTLVGDAGGLLGSVATGDLYVSLHTAEPPDYANQTTYACTYGGYARVAVPRTSAGWTVAGSGSASPTVMISFPTSTSGTELATHFGIGTDPTGEGKLLYSGTVTPQIDCSTGETPQLEPFTTIVEI